MPYSVLDPDTDGECVGHQQITGIGTSTAVSLTPTAGKTVYACVVGFTGDTIRFRLDGIDPTTTVGIRRTATDFQSEITIRGSNNVRNFRLIATSGTAVADIAYFGTG